MTPPKFHSYFSYAHAAGGAPRRSPGSQPSQAQNSTPPPSTKPPTPPSSSPGEQSYPFIDNAKSATSPHNHSSNTPVAPYTLKTPPNSPRQADNIRTSSRPEDADPFSLDETAKPKNKNKERQKQKRQNRSDNKSHAKAKKVSSTVEPQYALPAGPDAPTDSLPRPIVLPKVSHQTGDNNNTSYVGHCGVSNGNQDKKSTTCPYTNDEDIFSLSPDRIFSLDSDPQDLPVTARVYLSILGWETDTDINPCEFYYIEQVVSQKRMLRGLAILQEARAKGEGFFYDNFDSADVQRHPRYPFLRTRTEIILEDLQMRRLNCDLEGPLERSGLFLTNLHLPLPPGLALMNDSDLLFTYCVSAVYGMYFPSLVLLDLPMDDFYDPDFEADEDGYLALDDDEIRDSIYCWLARLIRRARVRMI